VSTDLPADLVLSDVRDRERKMAFLSAFRRTASLSHASRMANISYNVHKNWLHRCPEYKKAYRTLREEAINELETEARRRAFEGILEPVFYKGEVVGHVRKYSDLLLIFLLRGYKPKRYRENYRDRGGGPNQPIKVLVGVDITKT